MMFSTLRGSRNEHTFPFRSGILRCDGCIRSHRCTCARGSGALLLRTGRSGGAHLVTACRPSPTCRPPGVRRKHRVESLLWPDSGTSSPYRLERPDYRDLSDRQAYLWPVVEIIRNWPRRPRSVGPGKSDRRASSSADRTDAVWFVVEAFRRSDGARLWEYRTRATGPLPEVHEKHNLANADSRHRRRAGLLRGSATDSSLRSTCRGVSSGRAISGLEYSRFETQWGHGSSPVLHG
jgi:hypothetical protein